MNHVTLVIPVARRAKLAEEAAGIEGVVVVGGIGCRCCFGAVVAAAVAAYVVAAAAAAVSGCRCRPRMRFWRDSCSIVLLWEQIV